MSGGDEPRPDAPQVDDLLQGTDMVREGNNMCFVSPEAEAASRATVAGQTDFENKDLEVMLAMVDGSRSQDLTGAADDLWDAAGKIKQIGQEITKHVDKVDWEGEFGTAFRTWGKDLGKNTVTLGDYTEQASKQLAAAGEGLSQVYSQIPRPDPSYAGAPRLESIPAPAKVDTNPTYAAAQKKEKDRQEAIAQMNRLTSYYRVSRENMVAEKEPHFGPMPQIGMPTPREWDPGSAAPSGSGGTSTAPSTGVSTSVPSPSSSTGAVGSTSGVVQSASTVDGGVVRPAVHMELDSVATPVAPPVDRTPHVVTPPANNTPTQTPGIAGPVGPQGPGSRYGASKPADGRAGTPRNLPPRSITGGGGGTPQGPRSVTGGGGTPQGRPPGMGRSPGIVGGTPQSTGNGNNASRIPRGTVVGGERGMMGRPPMGMGGGAAGGPSGAAGNGGAARRLASSPGGVVGNPRSGALSGGTARPFTPGGTGLTQSGSGGRPMGMAPRTGPSSPGDRSRNDSERPDYLTEDEETWLAGRNGYVPPVIE